MQQYTKKAPATADAHLSIVMLFKQSHDTKSSIFPPLRQKTSSVPYSARSAKFPPAPFVPVSFAKNPPESKIFLANAEKTHYKYA